MLKQQLILKGEKNEINEWKEKGDPSNDVSAQLRHVALHVDKLGFSMDFLELI